MKSKFTQIVNIKKRNLDKIELNLARTRNEAAMIEGFIAQAAEQISKFEMPSSGSAADLRGSLELLGAMRREKNLLTERLELTKKSIAHLERQYKAANLEYEKMKYLQTQDFSAQIEKIKKAEAAALDEFATMNFTRQKNANQ